MTQSHKTDQQQLADDKVIEWVKAVTYELNAIRARDGSPQHIDWHQGRPLQTSSVTDEYWNELTETGFRIIKDYSLRQTT